MPNVNDQRPDFPTREQESRIAALALDHGKVEVAPDPETMRVLVRWSTGAELLDKDGNDVAPEVLTPTTAALEVPLDLVRRLIAPERLEAALADASETPYHLQRYRIGGSVQTAFVDGLREALEPRADAAFERACVDADERHDAQTQEGLAEA